MSADTSDWVAVGDQLPERGREVLVYVVSAAPGYPALTSFAYHSGTDEDRRASNQRSHWYSYSPMEYTSRGINTERVTHWMPLPEKPVQGVKRT